MEEAKIKDLWRNCWTASGFVESRYRHITRNRTVWWNEVMRRSSMLCQNTVMRTRRHGFSTSHLRYGQIGYRSGGRRDIWHFDYCMGGSVSFLSSLRFHLGQQWSGRRYIQERTC